MRDILDPHELRHWLEVLCGGLNLTEIWRMWYKTVRFAKHIATYVRTYVPPAAPLQPWEWPQRAWARVHIDYAGLLLG